MVCIYKYFLKKKKQLTFYIFLPGEPIMPNPRVNITETQINEYTTDMDLVIKTLHKRDFGEYTCVSENTIGRAEGKIRLIGKIFIL